MLWDFAFAQLASTRLSSGSLASPYFSPQLGNVAAAAPAAGFALDRERGNAKVREGVGVVSQAPPSKFLARNRRT